MWHDGRTVREIADTLGYTHQAISYHMSKDRKRFPSRRVTRQRRELWMARIEAGRYTRAEAAEALGITRQAVDAWFRKE